jgi:hypothetical protein
VVLQCSLKHLRVGEATEWSSRERRGNRLNQRISNALHWGKMGGESKCLTTIKEEGERP